jgi:hypothetical protein
VSERAADVVVRDADSVVRAADVVVRDADSVVRAADVVGGAADRVGMAPTTGRGWSHATHAA